MKDFKLLKKNDKITIVAPASPFDEKKFSKGVNVIKNMGFDVSFNPDIYSKNNFFAGSDNRRLNELENAFKDKGTKAIFCARGGYGSMRLLDKIDYNIIRNNPKPFIGFSDITALLNNFVMQAGIPVIHGPVVTSSAYESKESLTYVKKLLLQGFSDYTLNLEPAITITGGKCKGIIVGGNLTILSHLIGTPYQPDFKDKILLLEDIGEYFYRIERMMEHLRLAGILNSICGVIIGQFTNCNRLIKTKNSLENKVILKDNTENTILDSEIMRIMQEYIKPYSIPSIIGFNCGHGNPNFPIVLGAEAELDSENLILRY